MGLCVCLKVFDSVPAPHHSQDWVLSWNSASSLAALGSAKIGSAPLGSANIGSASPCLLGGGGVGGRGGGRSDGVGGGG